MSGLFRELVVNYTVGFARGIPIGIAIGAIAATPIILYDKYRERHPKK